MAVGMVLAAIGGYIAIRLRLSPIFGYLVAGIVMGPHIPGFTGDAHIAHELAEIGVMLLMFGVGMHFSVADLWAMRSIAVPGAVVQIVVATLLGAGVAHLWGWSLGAGLIFGLALSVAAQSSCCARWNPLARSTPRTAKSPSAGSSSKIWSWS